MANGKRREATSVKTKHLYALNYKVLLGVTK